MNTPDSRKHADTDANWAVCSVNAVVQFWALFGGAVLIGVVLVNFISAIGSAVLQPIPGDLELTEMGVAIAVFAFLPYCQMTAANVSADIFTSRASPKMVAAWRAVADVVALLFSTILLWRMSLGMLDQYVYGYTTSILRLPHWFAYVPILLSLLLLASSSLVSLTKDARELLESERNG